MRHSHPHDPRSRRFVLALTLTGLIFFAEFFGGLWTGSLALLSDSGHVFMDAFALGVSYLALRLAQRPSDERHTFGFHRAQVLAALLNSVTLLLIAWEILHEAWNRFQNPQPVQAGPMLVIAVVGLAVNLLVAFVLREHDHDDLNTRSAFLHVLGDALASIGVIASGLLLLFFDWPWLDPLVSVGIGLLIVASGWRVLRESVHILNEGAPIHLDTAKIQAEIRATPGVEDVHDLHVWTLSPGYTSLSVHVQLDAPTFSKSQEILNAIHDMLDERFGIRHSTIQFECEHCQQDICEIENPLG